MTQLENNQNERTKMCLDDILHIFTEEDLYKPMQETFSKEGNDAYNKLKDILYNIGEITETKEPVNLIIKKLDNLVYTE